MSAIGEAVAGAVGQPSSVRIGTVTSVSPLTVVVQGVTFANLGFLDWYTPVLGHTVALLGQSSASGSDPTSWLCLGNIVSTP